VLGHAFNLMATDLSAMYADFEARVERQAQALRTSNRSLQRLYHRDCSTTPPGTPTKPPQPSNLPNADHGNREADRSGYGGVIG
jgi:hypothetical protein